MQSSPSLQGYDLPANVLPPDDVCLTIQIPNDPAYISAVVGALYDTTLWLSWQRDAAHTGTLAAQQMKRRWFQAVQNIGACGAPPETCIPEQEFDDMSLCEQLRFQDGKLQALCCGEWKDIDGQAPQGVGGPSQPGDSQQPTSGGGCQTYKGNMGGGAPWYVPTVVSSGDTLDLTLGDGLFYSDQDHSWYTPDGFFFFATKTGTQNINPGSFVPTQGVGRIVAKIGTAFYDIQGGPFTVPSGFDQATVQLFMNDTALTGNGGDVSFSIQVCNNAPADWTSTFNFRLQDYPSLFSFTFGTWTPGVGWVGQPGTGQNSTVVLELIVPSSTIVGAQLTYSSDGGDPVSSQAYVNDGTGFICRDNPIVNASNHTIAGITNTPSVTNIEIAIGDGTTGTFVQINQLVISGQGTKPAGWP